MSVEEERRYSQVPHELFYIEDNVGHIEFFNLMLAPSLLGAFKLWVETLSKSDDEQVLWVVNKMKDRQVPENVSNVFSYQLERSDEDVWRNIDVMIWARLHMGKLTVEDVTDLVTVFDDRQPGIFATKIVPDNRRINPAQAEKAYSIWLNSVVDPIGWYRTEYESDVPYTLLLNTDNVGMPNRIWMCRQFWLDKMFGFVYIPDWVRNQPFSQKFWDYFGEFYDTYADERLIRGINSQLRSALPEQPGLTLDAGSGSGGMERVWGDKGKLIGVDISKVMCTYSKMTGEAVERGYIEQLPFRENTFDNAVMSFSWHWLLDPQAALVEIERVLKPWGQLVYNVRRPQDGWEEEHKRDLEAAGFEIERMEMQKVEREGELYYWGLVVARKVI